MNEAEFRALVSGERRGVVAALFRAGLRCLSFGYAGASGFRNRLYDLGLKKSHHPGVPVVSVGNITTGGTGKTPMVAFLANWFRERNINPAILSRGYRAVEGGANDEKMVLDLLCPGIVHLQNPDRVASANIAVKQHAAQALILDDGFQHRRLARDLDLVLIDATCPWGYGAVLPRGLLREPLSKLRRADFAVITRADQVPETELAQIRREIQKHHPPLPTAEAAFVPRRLVNAEGKTASFAEFRGKLIAAFCGIGNPEGFRQTLLDSGMSVDPCSFGTFADHHHYTESEFKTLGELAQSHQATAILTTQKDLVKIPHAELSGVPLWAVEIGVQWLTGEEQFLSRLKPLLETRPSQNRVDGPDPSS